MKKMDKRALCVFTTISLLLTGCVLSKRSAGRSYLDIYRADDSGRQILVAERVRYSGSENLLDAVISSLNSVPDGNSMSRVFPPDVKMLYCSVQNGTASVEMTDSYGALSGIEKTLTDYAITLTLTSIDSICDVNIFCGDEPVAIGLTPEDAVLADAGFEPYEKIIKVYLPDEGGEHLECRSRKITAGDEDSEAALVAETVLSEITEISKDISVISADVVNGLCILNLSNEFYDTVPESESMAELVIYALVDSLTYISGIQRVIIQVEGETVSSYGSYHAYWSKSFDAELVKYS